LNISELIYKNQEEPASVSKGVWLAHTPISVPDCSGDKTLSCRLGCDPELHAASQEVWVCVQAFCHLVHWNLKITHTQSCSK